MRIPRLHTDAELLPGAEIVLDKTASHHLSTVLRVREGQQVSLFNNDGYDYLGNITATGKATRIALTERHQNHTESPLQTTLLLGISRGDRMDFAVQKSVELGVTRVIAFHARQSLVKRIKDRDSRRLQHWQAITKSAAEQSGRACMPLVQSCDNFGSALSHATDLSAADQQTLKVLLHPKDGKPLTTICSQHRDMEDSASARIIIAIGPEQGFADEELTLAIEQGFYSVTLGPRVLRTETAPIAALTLLQTLLGDFR